MMTIVDLTEARNHRERLASYTSQKLAMLDRAMADGRLTDLDFRVLYYLASAADRETGIARRKQAVIAGAVQRTRRAIQISTDRLSEFGYLIILTKDGGSYTNGYRLIVEKTNKGSPFESKKANVDSPYAKKRRMRTAKKANGSAEKGEPSFAPILPFNSLDTPSRARGPSSTDVLGPAAALERRLGSEKFSSWFGGVSIVEETEDTITLKAPTKFKANYLIQHFETDILAAWQVTKPSVVHIRIQHG